MRIQIATNEDELIQEYAKFFIGQAQKNIRKKGFFTVVLSGGSSPKKVYELLAESYNSEIDWKKIYFFFGDERYVHIDNIQSNFLMAKNTLFKPLKIPLNHIFRYDTSLQPSECAVAYANQINNFFKNKDAAFDLVMLGLGEDSHTASLFPFTSILEEKTASIKEVFLKNENVYRISMTAEMINSAAEIAFLVFGKNKAKAVFNVLEGEQNYLEFPAQLISRKAIWFLDKKAADKI